MWPFPPSPLWPKDRISRAFPAVVLHCRNTQSDKEVIYFWGIYSSSIILPGPVFKGRIPSVIHQLDPFGGALLSILASFVWFPFWGFSMTDVYCEVGFWGFLVLGSWSGTMIWRFVVWYSSRFACIALFLYWVFDLFLGSVVYLGSDIFWA